MAPQTHSMRLKRPSESPLLSLTITLFVILQNSPRAAYSSPFESFSTFGPEAQHDSADHGDRVLVSPFPSPGGRRGCCGGQEPGRRSGGSAGRGGGGRHHGGGAHGLHAARGDPLGPAGRGQDGTGPRHRESRGSSLRLRHLAGCLWQRRLLGVAESVPHGLILKILFSCLP